MRSSQEITEMFSSAGHPTSQNACVWGYAREIPPSGRAAASPPAAEAGNVCERPHHGAFYSSVTTAGGGCCGCLLDSELALPSAFARLTWSGARFSAISGTQVSSLLPPRSRLGARGGSKWRQAGSLRGAGHVSEGQLFPSLPRGQRPPKEASDIQPSWRARSLLHSLLSLSPMLPERSSVWLDSVKMGGKEGKRPFFSYLGKRDYRFVLRPQETKLEISLLDPASEESRFSGLAISQEN